MIILEVWPIKMGFGVNWQVLPAEQVRVIAPVKLLGPFASMVKSVWVFPMSVGLSAVGDVSVKAAAPVPESNIDCGLPVALSLMLNAATRAPLAVGVKVTLMLQLCPTPRTPL